MKHVQNYYDYITEGKKQYKYAIRVGKTFNIFDLLNTLKPIGGELLDNQPAGNNKDEIVITIAMDDSKKAKIEEEISKVAEIL